MPTDPSKVGPFNLAKILFRLCVPTSLQSSSTLLYQPTFQLPPPRNRPLGKADFTQTGNVLTTCPSGQTMGCFKLTYTANVGPYTSVFANIGTGGLTKPIKVPSAWGC